MVFFFFFLPRLFLTSASVSLCHHHKHNCAPTWRRLFPPTPHRSLFKMKFILTVSCYLPGCMWDIMIVSSSSSSSHCEESMAYFTFELKHLCIPHDQCPHWLPTDLSIPISGWTCLVASSNVSAMSHLMVDGGLCGVVYRHWFLRPGSVLLAAALCGWNVLGICRHVAGVRRCVSIWIRASLRCHCQFCRCLSALAMMQGGHIHLPHSPFLLSALTLLSSPSFSSKLLLASQPFVITTFRDELIM